MLKPPRYPVTIVNSLNEEMARVHMQCALDDMNEAQTTEELTKKVLLLEAALNNILLMFGATT
jgi:hypothetical protein